MNITLITREDCVYCDNAKKMIKNGGHTYTEKMIGRDIEREDVLEKFPTQKMLPVVVVNEELVGGYIELLDYLNPPLQENLEDGK